MGIAFSFLEFFDVCYHQQALRSPMIALGSLRINEPDRDIQTFAAQNPYWHRDHIREVHSLFRDRYGVTEYCDCDLNDQADIKLDLNTPLDAALVGSAMTILNGGTVEHAFDVARAMVNIHHMARLGATIIHLSPISWYNHGYYNFNPRLFAAIAEVNQYRLVAEAFWLDTFITVESPVRSSQPLQSGWAKGFLQWLIGQEQRDTALQNAQAIRGLARPTLHMTFDGHQYTPQRDVVSTRLSSLEYIPANVLYLVAYQKTVMQEFVFPYDIQG